MDSYVEHQEQPIGTEVIGEETFMKIENVDRMRPFFMSLLSPYDHWLFISSNGGLTAGRKNNGFSLFPYYTDDKITETKHISGSHTVIKIATSKGLTYWEPFKETYTKAPHISRNLFKNVLGNRIIFEEMNSALKLSFRYEWTTSDSFGFVRHAQLINHSSEEIFIEIIDGIQNILPAGITSDLQNVYSNLVDAYKRSELDVSSGLGIFALSAIIVDRAEPSEALNANIAWSTGLNQPTILLSSKQLSAFFHGMSPNQETDIKGEKGAYLVHSKISLTANSSKDWYIVSDVYQDHSKVIQTIQKIKDRSKVLADLKEDILKNSEDLRRLAASADGLQKGSDPLKNARHYANVMYNIMRGGIMDDNYKIDRSDFIQYLFKANQKAYITHEASLSQLPENLTLFSLQSFLSSNDDNILARLITEYLPLKFSRRHGDPSRPWNKFSINLKNPLDGSKILDYQGNWRDIFQNWEALAYSYPGFLEGMVFKFLNASTFDGYNPYRVTKGGFDWEVIEPDDPWSYIGYWGDHQIIYLLKLLECLHKHQPQRINELLDKEYFVYAEVPYKIKPYDEIIKNPKDTVIFDHEWDESLQKRKKELGADGALIITRNTEKIHEVNFIEKILATVLAKLSNFIPEAGIWLNTQRPEWNDANNALVGNGVSMVTLYYLRRFIIFFEEVLKDPIYDKVVISIELAQLFQSLKSIFSASEHILSEQQISSEDRKKITEELGRTASTYRDHIYNNRFSGDKAQLNIQDILIFFKEVRKYLEQSIEANKRNDHLYHGYNIININEDGINISYLNEMLESQVAVLSSGYLNSSEALKLLDSLRSSALYRENQNSYILYPNKDIPGFLQKNIIPKDAIKNSKLLQKLENDQNQEIMTKDGNGVYHFHNSFRNNNDLISALDQLEKENYGDLIDQEKDLITGIYESVFNHKEFTGRSGTFFGYEGLGSIYWHMVSKLLLAAQECFVKAVENNESKEIIQRLGIHYYEIYEGLGVHKSPERYGAFPTDPYSHTPFGKGAQQPGMTGQVKEDILCRNIELGVHVSNGQISFMPNLLKEDEFISDPSTFTYIDVSGAEHSIQLPENSLAFTYCQVPIIYNLGEINQIEISRTQGQKEVISKLTINQTDSSSMFNRSGQIEKVTITITNDNLLNLNQ